MSVRPSDRLSPRKKTRRVCQRVVGFHSDLPVWLPYHPRARLPSGIHSLGFIPWDPSLGFIPWGSLGSESGILTPRIPPSSKSPRQNSSVGLFSVLLYTTNLIYDMYIQQTVYAKFINKPYNNTFGRFLLYTTNHIRYVYTTNRSYIQNLLISHIMTR